jgi:hypothetical protein
VIAGGWRSQLAAVDARQPWFAPYAASLEALQQAVRHDADSATALCRCHAVEPDAGLAGFVPAGALPPGESYETFVARTGTVPTRDNLHDLFNGLVWRQFPQAKRRLNELQAAQIAAHGAAAMRGPIRDAITVFDENGALLDAPAALWDALLARDWIRAFVDLRPLWPQTAVRLFGHALLEKLAQPRKAITAHVWRVQCPIGSTAEVDGWLAAQLGAESLAGKPFMPVPLLGIPGWCAENDRVSFYDDPVVFRRPLPGALDLAGPNLT